MSTERTESEGFYEMLWDCDHCAAKSLLGKSQRCCPECGAPQNPDKRYFPSPEQQQRIEGYAYQGADRTCPACQSPMGARASHCTHCGTPLDGSADVREVEDRSAKLPPPTKRRRVGRFVIGGLVVVAALAVGIWWLFVRKHDAVVTVTAHRWQRAIAVEQFGPHQQSAWRDQVPPNAQLPICQLRDRSSRQVQDGEDCRSERKDKKDGTFEQVKKCTPKTKSVPIQDQWCTFTVESWSQVDEVKASGSGLEPTWPAQGLPPHDAPPTPGARREGPRRETLTVDFGAAGACDVDDPTWRRYADGQKLTVEIRSRSDEVVCSSL
jgi:hypothetical protein